MAAEEIRRIREEWDLPTTKVEEGEDGALENMMSGLAESAEVRACAEMYGSGEDLDFGNWTKEPAKVLGHKMCLSLDGLLQTHGSCSFRLDDEHPGMMRMQDFLEYVRKDAFGDAAPLYIFDSQMWRREEMSQLTAQFTAPKWLPRDESHDMFKGPGETIWIPANWWHVAINIEECFAVTQNLALSRDMNRVIADLFHIEPYACKQFFSSHRLHGRLKENALRALHRCGGSIRDLEHHDE
eukprot:g1650.t1